jgi:hypothetical protein
MVASARTMAVRHNSCMNYRAIKERGLARAFHSGVNIGELTLRTNGATLAGAKGARTAGLPRIPNPGSFWHNNRHGHGLGAGRMRRL